MMNVEKVIELWGQNRRGIIETIDKFADRDLAFTAYDGGYPVGELIQQIALEEFSEVQYGLTFHLETILTQFGDAEYTTINSLKDLLSETHEATIEFLRTLKDSDLTAEFEARWGERKPLIEFIIHVMEHEIYHRGELSLILGLLGHEGLDA